MKVYHLAPTVSRIQDKLVSFRHQDPHQLAHLCGIGPPKKPGPLIAIDTHLLKHKLYCSQH